MYINFWYPIALSKDITNEKPLKVQIMGLKFAAFRDTGGAAHVISNTCIHRGGALGRGKIKGDRVACPYHGWQFSGNGKCSHIPTQVSDQSPPARAKVDSYPTAERYGILFAFLGDLPEAERPPIFDIPEFSDEKWRANHVALEMLTTVDKPILRYREMLKEWEAQGWRIDWRALQDQRGDVAFAIPGPARRTEKNWILHPVPLHPPTGKS